MEISIHFLSFLSSDSPSVAGPCLTTVTLRSNSLQIGVKQGPKLLDANKSFLMIFNDDSHSVGLKCVVKSHHLP